MKSTGNQWLYSQKAVDVVQSYAMKFPRLFELLTSKADFVFESELNAGREVDILNEVTVEDFVRTKNLLRSIIAECREYAERDPTVVKRATTR